MVFTTIIVHLCYRCGTGRLNMGQINLVIVVQLIIKFLVIVSGQNLNVIPNLLRNYVNEFPQLQTLNVLANMSDVVFSNAKYDTSVKLGK